LHATAEHASRKMGKHGKFAMGQGIGGMRGVMRRGVTVTFNLQIILKCCGTVVSSAFALPSGKWGGESYANWRTSVRMGQANIIKIHLTQFANTSP